MPAPLIFILYILVSAVVLHLVCIPIGKWTLWLYIPAFLFGWFIIIGIAVEKDTHSKLGDILAHGRKTGTYLLKNWLMCMAGLIVVSMIIGLLFC